MGAGRRDAERILRAAIAAADPSPLVSRALHGRTDLAGPIHIVAIGKAAASMAEAATRALGRGRVAGGAVVVPHDTPAEVGAPLELLRAAHPIPDATSLRAGERLALLLEAREATDTVLVLLSGGASALAVLPVQGVSIEGYADRVRALMLEGADIRTLNTMRRQIDSLKAGGMARLAAPARVVGLVLSDVIGDPLDMIASGPLTPDAAAAASNVEIVVIGNNAIAREGAAASARALGYDILMQEVPIVGEARLAGRALALQALELQRSLARHARPVCLIAGGETTVTVRGSGRGGRNQELVLGAARALDGARGITIGSAGTDGIDGASPAAGAIAEAGAIDPDAAAASLHDNDAFTLLHAAGATLMTGPTGTNVLDVQVVLVYGSATTS